MSSHSYGVQTNGGEPQTNLPTASTHTSESLLVTVEEAARLLCVHRATVYDLLGRGELSSVKIGRRRLISRTALLHFIVRSESGGLA